MLTSRETIKQIFAEAKENIRRRDGCRRHYFHDIRPEFGQKFTCSECGYVADILYIRTYADGYKAAGGDPGDIASVFATEAAS